MSLYEARTYRNRVEDKGLVSFQVALAESDLFIRAENNLASEGLVSLKHQRRIIQDYIEKNPDFATTLKPCVVKDGAPDIIREMVRASVSCGVGPMAAVAGAIAEFVGKDLLEYSSEIIVENGGDIFMKTGQAKKVGIFAGKSRYSGKLALEIAPGDCWGICTSSATVGPSLSFGKADAVVVVCNSAVLADAWATSLANTVKAPGDVEKTLKFVENIPAIKGVVIIIGEKMGVRGDIKLVKVRP